MDALPVLSSTLLLSLLLGVGLVFFLRAASKDRTTDVVVSSYRSSLVVLDGLGAWLQQRGWQLIASNPDRRAMVYEGHVAASRPLAVFLALLGSCGGAALGLVVRELLPGHTWWPLSLSLLGPAAAPLYLRRAQRRERLELRLLSDDDMVPVRLALRGHRDELISAMAALGAELQLKVDQSLQPSLLG